MRDGVRPCDLRALTCGFYFLCAWNVILSPLLEISPHQSKSQGTHSDNVYVYVLTYTGIDSVDPYTQAKDHGHGALLVINPHPQKCASNRLPVSKLLLAVFLFSSLKNVMLSVLSSLFPKPLRTSSSTRARLYETFQFESDECDREFMKIYDEDLNAMLIFVRILFACTSVAMFIWFSWGYRPVCSPQLHPLSW